MNNFYRHFLPGIARTLRTLTDALAGNPWVVNWSQELRDAFVKAKSPLSSALSLTPSAEVSLLTDASNTQVGATERVRWLAPSSFLLCQALRHTTDVLHLL